jgi:hypothetical protein
LTADIGKEEKALRAIQTILSRSEGRKDEQPTLITMASVLMEKSFRQPIELLDSIDELLGWLQSVNWDVSIPKEARDSMRKDIEQSTQNMNDILSRTYPNPFLQIDEYVGEYRRFLYLLLHIQNLNGSVRSLCKNYEIATKKLLGEPSETLE